MTDQGASQTGSSVPTGKGAAPSPTTDPARLQAGGGKKKKKKKNKRQAVAKQHNLWDLLWSWWEVAAQILQQLRGYPFPKLRLPSQNLQPNIVYSLKLSS